MFVLLEHTTPEDVHWDFLIEVPGNKLFCTWRLGQNPLSGCEDVSAERIADHQARFLEYEGRLRRAPGSVRRLDRGKARVEHEGGGRLVARLDGEHLRGRLEIVSAPGGVGRFCLINGTPA